MNQSKISVRYAKAFFQVAQEKNVLKELRSNIDLVSQACKQTDFILLLESPIVKIYRKKEIFRKLFGENVNDLTLNFLNMIADNKREAYIPAICRNFVDQYRKLNGIKAAKVTTATALDKKEEEKIKVTIAKLFNTQVELTTEEDSEIIGGFILRVGDQQIDASVANKLRKIEREFLNTTI